MKKTTETLACLLAVAAILAIAAGAERSKPKHLMPAVALTARTRGAGSSSRPKGRDVGRRNCASRVRVNFGTGRAARLDAFSVPIPTSGALHPGMQEARWDDFCDLVEWKFIRDAGPIFSKESFYENGLVNQPEGYGNMTQVLSSYESRHSPGEKPFQRGINSFQVVNDGTR